jgi:hypothetical protein
MIYQRLIIILIVSTVLTLGGGFAITHGFVTPREAGVFGMLLLVIPTVVLTLLFKSTGLTPNERAAQAQRDFKKRSFGLYLGLISATFALIKVFDVTRAEPLYMKVIFRGFSVAGLGLIAAGISLAETRSRWLWLRAKECKRRFFQ